MALGTWAGAVPTNEHAMMTSSIAERRPPADFDKGLQRDAGQREEPHEIHKNYRHRILLAKSRSD